MQVCTAAAVQIAALLQGHPDSAGVRFFLKGYG